MFKLVKHFLDLFFLGFCEVDTSLTPTAPISTVVSPLTSAMTRSTSIATCPTV
ncbi:hypothetical protein DPMN_191580 [Dreissena polymorpha]|uniref:Uncharacterized protein n=1 Tax=Dreissena polymorpha TaxID=45954 RepID=A0A9D4BEE3_DREPO|nr:hypothetical protein DPMN_191580 [Dreissena polymorpha]